MIGESANDMSESVSLTRSLIHGRGEMADRIRQHDWNSTVLGPASQWPQALVDAVNLLLSCRFPGIVFWGAEMIQFYNDACVPLMGDKHPQGLGQVGAECWKDAWPIVGSQLSNVLATGEPLYKEKVLVPVERGGKLRDVYWTYSYSPIFLRSSEAGGVLSLCHDVTAELLADRRLRLATETARLGSWELDLTTGHMECSAQCKANYGRPQDAPFPYEALREVIHPEDRESMQAAVDASLSDGSDYNTEYRVIWPDNSVHWLLLRGNVVRDASGRPYQMTGTSLDVTERHAAQEALLRSEKLAAVGRLATTIAHEINNPLESVTNLLYLAKGSTEFQQTQEYLDTAEQELLRVSAIANQTLKFYKQSTNASYVTCLELFSSVLDIYQGRITNSRIYIEKRKRANQGVQCFDGEIRQVVSNLVGNAIDAMHPGGGRLILRSRETTEWRTGNRGLLLTIADTGTGINSLALRNVFDAFYTTKGLLGTGLGLWVSKEIVSRHSGSLRVRSSTASGRSGTVFNLFLPFEAAVRNSSLH